MFLFLQGQPLKMNPEQPEHCQSPTLQAFSLSDIEEWMGHNVEWVQELQDNLVQSRASLSQESAVSKAFQGKEVLLANIIEEEKAH